MPICVWVLLSWLPVSVGTAGVLTAWLIRWHQVSGLIALLRPSGSDSRAFVGAGGSRDAGVSVFQHQPRH